MKQTRVFIVDDDKDFAESMAMVLESRNCIVEIAASGEEAIDKFRFQNFDIAFMDIKLPGKNGVESFMKIREFKPHARVVMMTGYSVEQLLDQALENGAWDVLKKPMNMKKVLEIIENIPENGILIADDDPDFVESLKDVLVNTGKKIFVARNGKEVIKHFGARSIDLLILDIRMPVMDGLKTYLELKRLGYLVPTIIVTAYAKEESENLMKFGSLSIKGILRKPFDPLKLLEQIKQLSK